jgi:hypothetical protein
MVLRLPCSSFHRSWAASSRGCPAGALQSVRVARPHVILVKGSLTPDFGVGFLNGLLGRSSDWPASS